MSRLSCSIPGLESLGYRLVRVSCFTLALALEVDSPILLQSPSPPPVITQINATISGPWRKSSPDDKKQNKTNVMKYCPIVVSV